MSNYNTLHWSIWKQTDWQSLSTRLLKHKSNLQIQNITANLIQAQHVVPVSVWRESIQE